MILNEVNKKKTKKPQKKQHKLIMSVGNAHQQKLKSTRNAYFSVISTTPSKDLSGSLNISAERRAKSCSPSVTISSTHSSSSLTWSEQCVTPTTPLPYTPTTTSSSTYTTQSSYAKTIASTTATTTVFSTTTPITTSITSSQAANSSAPTIAITTTATPKPITTRISSSVLLSNSTTTKALPTIANVQNINNRNNNNEQQKLKRNRTTRSPGKITEQTNEHKKQKNITQTTLQEYWLGKPNTTNKYALLAVDDDEYLTDNSNNGGTKQNSTAQNIKPTQSTVLKVNKPPPIYVQGVQQISILTKALNRIAENNFILKSLRSSDVRIQASDSKSYSAIVKLLREKNTKYYTYKPKEERGFKVILRHMHFSTDTNEIVTELKELGHDVQNIFNMQQSSTRQPLSLFSLDLKSKPNNKDIYQITTLLNTKILFEPPHYKKTIAQCSNCQKYGHTKNYCTRDPVCVKCAGNHKTLDCKASVGKEQIRCALCEGAHTANYKGCEVYKALKVQRFPALREKKVQDQPTNLKITSEANNTVQPGISYAQVTKKQNYNPEKQHLLTAPCKENNKDTAKEQTPNNDMTELKEMMKQLLQQISTMMNLLTLLVPKIDTQNGR